MYVWHLKRPQVWVDAEDVDQLEIGGDHPGAKHTFKITDKPIFECSKIKRVKAPNVKRWCIHKYLRLKLKYCQDKKGYDFYTNVVIYTTYLLKTGLI
jgi:hypothetical protein